MNNQNNKKRKASPNDIDTERKKGNKQNNSNASDTCISSASISDTCPLPGSRDLNSLAPEKENHQNRV